MLWMEVLVAILFGFVAGWIIQLSICKWVIGRELTKITRELKWFRFPYFELVSVFVALLSYLFFKGDIATGLGFYLFAILSIAVAITDWYSYEISNVITLGGTVVGFILSFFRNDINWLEVLVAILFGVAFILIVSFVYYVLKRIVPLGLGDASYLAMAGAFGGISTVYFALLLGSVLAMLYYLPQILKSKSLQFAIPLIPFLAVGGIIGFLLRFFGNCLSA
jgi:leader peptidase (prepilin peptidase)/N-methyltransferase